MKECWKLIPGYGDTYLVSDKGRVKSFCKGTEGTILRPSVTSSGYKKVAPRGKIKTVHALVADAFIGPCPEGYEILHKDGNKLNDCASNLEYVKQNSTRVKLTPTDIDFIRAQKPPRQNPAKELAEKFGVSAGHIYKIWGKR